MEKNIATYRKDWLDSLRAVAIMLVVFGHQVPWAESYFAYTSPVKIPLFFAISGYLFKVRDGKFSTFAVNLFKKLIFPYFALSFISAIMSFPLSGKNVFINNCYGIVSGDTFWFMPCLIIGEIVFFALNRIARNQLVLGILSLIMFVVGMILLNYGIGTFGMFNIALQVQLYLYMGLMFKKHEETLGRIKEQWLALGGLLYIVLCYLGHRFSFTDSFDPHLGDYDNIPFVFSLILLGNTLLFSIAPHIRHWPTVVTYIGRNTLIIYLWAGWGITVFNIFIRLAKFDIQDQMLRAPFEFVSAIAFCCICALFINRYIPILVGKSSKKNSI